MFDRDCMFKKNAKTKLSILDETLNKQREIEQQGKSDQKHIEKSGENKRVRHTHTHTHR